MMSMRENAKAACIVNTNRNTEPIGAGEVLSDMASLVDHSLLEGARAQ